MNIGLRLLGLLLAPAVLIVACTFRIENPTITSSTATDAITFYVEPYKVHDGHKVLTKGEWNRDLFIKKALVDKINARFVEDAAKAQMTIKTEEFGLTGSLKTYSITKFNNTKVKTTVDKPSFFTKPGTEPIVQGFNLDANGDAELTAIIAEKILSGKTLHNAEATIIVTEGLSYGGLRNIKLE